MPTDISLDQRFGACIPKKMLRSMKMKEKADKKNAKEGKEQKAEHVGGGIPQYVELLFFEHEEDGICGKSGECHYPLSDMLPCGRPVPGEVWRCMLDPKAQFYTTCIPVEKLSEAGETPSGAEDEATETEQEAPAVQSADTEKLSALNAALEKYRDMVAELQEENSKYKAKCREVETLSREKSELEAKVEDSRREIKGLNENNSQLRMQISSLERKSRNFNIGAMEDRIRNLESENTSLKFEADRLAAIIETNDIDTGNVKGDRIFAILTGSDTMHSNAFAPGRYTVQFGRNFTTLRLIPDENGAVECKDGDIRLPALGFAKFEHLEKLSTVIEDGVITVEA